MQRLNIADLQNQFLQNGYLVKMKIAENFHLTIVILLKKVIFITEIKNVCNSNLTIVVVYSKNVKNVMLHPSLQLFIAERY